MAEADVSCLDCHQGDDEQIVKPTLSGCVDCHDDEYEEMGHDWQAEVIAKIAELEQAFNSIQVAGLNVSQQSTLSKDLRSFDAIKGDGSKGIHNNEEFLRVMDELIERYAEFGSGS
jgi:hypothetical protein